MSDGLWALIGVIIGGLLTFFSQYFFEKRHEKIENKKLFFERHNKINNNIFIIQQALKQFLSFAKLNLNNYSDDDLEEGELYQSIIHFSNECSIIWNDFRDILLTYFFKSADDTSFIILDKTISIVISSNPGVQYFDVEIFKNIHNVLQKSKNDFSQAISVIDSIKNDYYKLWKNNIRIKL